MFGKITNKGVKSPYLEKLLKQEKANGNVLDLGLKKSKRIAKEMEQASKSLSEKTNPSSDQFVSQATKSEIK